MTGEDKIANVESQLRALEEKRTNVLNCPYCGTQTFNGDTLCCMTLAKCIRAIMQREVTGELAAQADRIAEAVDRASSN